MQQTNSAHGSASVSVDTDIAQWIGQFQNAGASDRPGRGREQLHINPQDGVSVSQVAQTRTTNLNNAGRPAGQPGDEPERRPAATRRRSRRPPSDTSSIDGWIHQAQGGVADIEQAEARQEGIVDQSNSASRRPRSRTS